jgi:hypothetical protein
MLTWLRTSMAGRDQGFTLIVVIIIIAIPVFLNQRKKAVDASLKSDIKAAVIAIETWIVDHPGDPLANDYTGDNNPLGEQDNPGHWLRSSGRRATCWRSARGGARRHPFRETTVCAPGTECV